MSQQSVQVHTQCLRTPSCEQVLPKPRSLGGIRQQVPSDVVESNQRSMLVLLRFPSCGMRSATELQTGKSFSVAGAHLSMLLSVQPTEHRSASVIIRRRSSHRRISASSDRCRSTRSIAFRPKRCSTSAGTLAVQSSTIQPALTSLVLNWPDRINLEHSAAKRDRCRPRDRISVHQLRVTKSHDRSDTCGPACPS